MFIKKLIIGILSFYAFEIKRGSLREDVASSDESRIERLYESRKRREQEKRKARLYDKKKWKQKRKYREQHYKLKGTNAKDVRFFNQQKLRRMFRNM